MTREAVINLVRSLVQPLMRGRVSSMSGLNATLDDLVPAGASDKFQQTYPFGFSAYAPNGVLAYFLNLFGRPQLKIVLGHLHAGRPQASAPGEVIVYCTNAAGDSVPVRFTLGNDGVLRVTATSKVQVQCDNIELGQGTLEKVLNGETFRTQFLQHTHQGNLGVPTGPVMQPFAEAEVLSTTVKANK